MYTTSKNVLEKSIEETWEHQYASADFTKLPWETGKPEEELVRLVKEGKIKKCKVLDLGSGSGTHAIYLAKSGFDVTGIDISKGAVKIARDRARKEGIKAKFLVGNAFGLRFRNGSFEFVFDRGCFHHVPKEFRDKFIRGVHRVLKDTGNYHLICFSSRNKWEEEKEKLFSLGKIKYYFSKYFEILEARETIHIQPDGETVYLRSVFMSKK